VRTLAWPWVERPAGLGALESSTSFNTPGESKRMMATIQSL